MGYTIRYEKRALKELSKLSSNIVKRILEKVESLALDPYQRGVKKRKGVENVFRVNTGNYRILYEINDDKLLVTIVAIGDRKDIYN